MKMLTKSIIFGIDGTLANISHRLHFVSNGARKWDEFVAACNNDLPIEKMIEFCNVMSAAGYRIILVSGRRSSIRTETELWLNENEVNYDALYMRDADDFRKDYIIKKEILAQIRKDFYNTEILFVVDDRTSVVKMWREEGLICLHCDSWNDEKNNRESVFLGGGILTLLVGPAGAGKSSWVEKHGGSFDILPSCVVSTDFLRIIEYSPHYMEL